MEFDLCNIDNVAAAGSPSGPPMATVRSSFGSAVDSTRTSGGMFASSSSLLASGSVNEGKIGSVLGLVYIRVIESVCGGIIAGEGEPRFCCKAAIDCVAQSHKTKVNLTANSFYIKLHRAGQARLTPSLPSKWLTGEITEADMMRMELDLRVWVSYFEGLHAKREEGGKRAAELNAEGDESSWEEVDVASLASLPAASTTFRTPKNLKLGAVNGSNTSRVARRPLFEPLTDIQVGDDDKEVGDEATKRGMAIVVSEWNTLLSNLEMISLEMDACGLGETAYRSVIWKNLEGLQDAIGGIGACLQLLGAGIGDVETEGEEGSMSLWEAISSIRIQGASRVGRVEDHVIDQRLTLEDIRTKMLEVERLLGELRAHYLENMPKISDHITDFHGRILKLETASKAGVSSSNLFGSISGSLGPNAGFSSPARPAPWVSQIDFEALKKYVSVAFQDIKETLGDLRASGKNSSTLEPLENGFAACTSYDKWVTGAEGYKQVLSTMLTNFTAGVMGPVITGNNPAITSLANALMGSLISQWHNLGNFIDSFLY